MSGEPGQGPTVSLVLGSGGARGLAHIGVVEVLEAHGYRVQSIAGCSMGALIGGIYAMGKLDVYRDWVCALERVDVLRLLDFSFGTTGLIKGERIIEVLRDSIGETRIEDLPIRFTAVATDLYAQREVWIAEGPLFEAIRASIAVPTLFQPVRRNGRLLVDGGLLNPVPIAPTMADDTELTIAVDLNGPPDPDWSERRRREERGPESPARDDYRAAIRDFVQKIGARLISSSDEDAEPDELGVFEIVNRSFDVMQGTVSRLKLAAYTPDVVIRVPRNVGLTYEFYRARELIAAGHECARDSLRTIERAGRRGR